LDIKNEIGIEIIAAQQKKHRGNKIDKRREKVRAQLLAKHCPTISESFSSHEREILSFTPPDPVPL
jgi:hypothetical protein